MTAKKMILSWYFNGLHKITTNFKFFPSRDGNLKKNFLFATNQSSVAKKYISACTFSVFFRMNLIVTIIGYKYFFNPLPSFKTPWFFVSLLLLILFYFQLHLLPFRCGEASQWVLSPQGMLERLVLLFYCAHDSSTDPGQTQISGATIQHWKICNLICSYRCRI